MLVLGLLEIEAKNTSCYMPHLSPVNLFVTENTHMFHFHVCWASKGALLYEVFQHRHASSTWWLCLAIKVDPRPLLPGCVYSHHTVRQIAW